METQNTRDEKDGNGTLQSLLEKLDGLNQKRGLDVLDQMDEVENRILEVLRDSNCKVGYNSDEIWEGPHQRYERSEFQIEHPECHISGGMIHSTSYGGGSTGMTVKSSLKFVSPEDGREMLGPDCVTSKFIGRRLHELAREKATYKCKLTMDYEDKFREKRRKRSIPFEAAEKLLENHRKNIVLASHNIDPPFCGRQVDVTGWNARYDFGGKYSLTFEQATRIYVDDGSNSHGGEDAGSTHELTIKKGKRIIFRTRDKNEFQKIHGKVHQYH